MVFPWYCTLMKGSENHRPRGMTCFLGETVGEPQHHPQSSRFWLLKPPKPTHGFGNPPGMFWGDLLKSPRSNGFEQDLHDTCHQLAFQVTQALQGATPNLRSNPKPAAETSLGKKRPQGVAGGYKWLEGISGAA